MKLNARFGSFLVLVALFSSGCPDKSKDATPESNPEPTKAAPGAPSTTDATDEDDEAAKPEEKKDRGGW